MLIGREHLTSKVGPHVKGVYNDFRDNYPVNKRQQATAVHRKNAINIQQQANDVSATAVQKKHDKQQQATETWQQQQSKKINKQHGKQQWFKRTANINSPRKHFCKQNQYTKT